MTLQALKHQLQLFHRLIEKGEGEKKGIFSVCLSVGIRESIKKQQRAMCCRSAQHSTHTFLAPCKKRVVHFSTVALADQPWRLKQYLKMVQPRQANPWQSCCDSCPGFHLVPETLCCYGHLARSEIDVPLPLRKELRQLWTISSSCAHCACRP